ncbi:hypothetical protein [Sphingomonas sp. CFBP 13706]|uniref:hypothetical protein n=1 Tax=Sphingomonas sp. CFBP 13706 TaxID=2775314 RepID=UPI00177C7B7D|nr:hypothetical protein [Sphingomonas sp. CFBP 13706]MBD8736220.1 hypothetical protein [Sphingomonas sp. CFBP 13706]
MTFAECLEAVEKAAEALSIVAPDVTSGKGKAFEAWAMLAIARHLSDMGATIAAVGCDDQPVTTFVVRGGPGHMPAASDDPATAPSHIVVERTEIGPQGQEVQIRSEIHLSLRHRSDSGATHELDLSVLPGRDAFACRWRGGGAFVGGVLVAVELKAYDGRESLNLMFARALLGTMLDLQPWRVIHDVELHMSGNYSRMLVPLSRPATMYLVTTTSLYDNSRRLLRRHDGVGIERVLPKTGAHRLEPIAREIFYL